MSALHHTFSSQLKREWVLTFRQIGLLLNMTLFFAMLLLFFPLAMPPDTHLLKMIAPGYVWIAALLAMMLASERLFQMDYEDGVIEQWRTSGEPLSIYIYAKLWVSWLAYVLPILILLPILALLFHLSAQALFVMEVSLICGTPGLLFLCALAAVMGLGIQQKGIMMAVILIPLAIPIMIFGSSATYAAMQNLPVSGYLALLLALSCLSAALLPLAMGAMLRIIN